MTQDDANPQQIDVDHPLAPLPASFEDARGALIPLLDDLSMRSALIIRSGAGTVRANHYHHTDWHYMYVLSGRLEYYHRPAGSQVPPLHLTVHAGEMVFTPPLYEHRVEFPLETVCVVLSRNARDQASYEADIVRMELPTNAQH